MTIVTRVDLLRNRRTKIIATLGPASRAPETISELLAIGVDVFRLNLSHGSYDDHRETHRRVRAAARALGRHVAILADLCGPKIRTGRFRSGQIELSTGEAVVITTREVLGQTGLIPSQYTALANDVGPGDRILLSDGAMELSVTRVEDSEVHCSVVHGGKLQDHKGINLPDIPVSAPSLTDKDREDARFMLELGVDFLALSFVRRDEDIHELRDFCRQAGFAPAIIAKIEKPEALRNSDLILQAADGIMIARGDLGVELAPEQVPLAQTQLIDKAQAHNVPVIVATQMLESMIDASRPTRAEVTDVSHAVTSGADAVMLSGETAAGAYPVQTVRMMDRIIRQTEAFVWQQQQGNPPPRGARGSPPLPFGDAVADATTQLSYDLQARGVVVISQTGTSAVTVSSARPAAPVVALSSHEHICRRMNLLWGVIPIHSEEVGSANPNNVARRVALELELAKPGQFILLVRGFHSDPSMNTPSVTVLELL